MNLADAIRLASQHKEAERGQERIMPSATAQIPYSEPTPLAVQEAPAPAVNQEASTMSENTKPTGAFQAGTTVRLEMFLTPDQLSSLFKAVAAGQHAMLTAREAASILRIPVSSLETMAQNGEVPGFQIDGRWRFSKQALDEWLIARQKSTKEAA
jgi:excisionase family DNA binding protein